MALRWIDGFESYGVTNGNTVVGINGKWPTSNADSNFHVQAGRIAGRSCKLNGFNGFTTPAFSSNDTWVVGFGFMQTTYTGANQIFQFYDSTTVQVEIEIRPYGELKAYRGPNETNGISESAGANLKPNIWAYIEVKVKIHPTAGTLDIHVNGASVLSLTGLNTRQSANSSADRITFVGGLNDNTFLDDLYVLDNTGSNNTTFLGPQKITAIFPTGDHGTNQWAATGAGTTHADRVKENPHDSSTTYLSDATSGDTEEFDYADTGSEVTSIKGVQVNTVFETDSGSAFSVKNHVSSGGTSSDDAGTAGTNGTYTTAVRVLETDPNTSALWTKTNLDAALFGVKTA